MDVEEFMGLLGGEHGRLALLHDVLRTADGGGRVHLQDLADDQVVEEHADGGEVLLHARSVERLPELLDVGGDEHRLQLLQGKPVDVAPVEEPPGRPGVRLAGVAVPDVRGEELDELPGRVLTRRRR